MKPLLYGNGRYWLAGAETLAVIKKRPVSSRIVNLALFSQGQNTEAVDQRGPNLIMCKGQPTGSAFESMKGAWRAAERGAQ